MNKCWFFIISTGISLSGLAQGASSQKTYTSGPISRADTASLAGVPAAPSPYNNLDFYMQQALQRSPLLKDYRNQVESAMVDSQIIRAGYRPQVTGSSVNTYAPTYKGWGYDEAISNGGNFSTLVGVNKALVGRKHLDAQYETIRLQNEGLANTSKITEQDLKKSVTAQYITTYGDMQQLKFNQDVYALLQKEETLLKDLTERNVYRQTDYLAFLVTLKQEGLLLRQLQIQAQNDYGSLNYLCGIMDTTSVLLEEPSVRLQSLPDISQSAFFRQYHIDSLKLRNTRSLVDFSYKPKASVYGDGGYSSTLAYNAYKNFGVSFGFTITMPIYDGRQRKLQYSKLEIAERTRTAYKDFFTSQYNQQIAQLTQQLHATEDLIGQINEQVRYSEALITVNGKLMQTGDAKIADYILALNNYLNAKNLLTQNNITRLQIINQINYWNR
jgi:outer membrane protein TolC